MIMTHARKRDLLYVAALLASFVMRLMVESPSECPTSTARLDLLTSH
ncbi:MAG TPA: hypothetical protein VHO07_31325 [Streptosporangiaceae bacterium]|jgi:hypothetical protein|nr:hypothetical protein [Streptosporangiaceae bacterium]